MKMVKIKLGDQFKYVNIEQIQMIQCSKRVGNGFSGFHLTDDDEELAKSIIVLGDLKVLSEEEPEDLMRRLNLDII